MEHLVPGLKRGPKKENPIQTKLAIQQVLVQWRNQVVTQEVWPGCFHLSSVTFLGDDVIEKIASCGERITSYSHLQKHVRWANGYDSATSGPNDYGRGLVASLQTLYGCLDSLALEQVTSDVSQSELPASPPADSSLHDSEAVASQSPPCMQPLSVEPVPPALFYAPLRGTQGQPIGSQCVNKKPPSEKQKGARSNKKSKATQSGNKGRSTKKK